jgi:ACS family D-galactonate transporter-like MFS transporter
VGTRASSRYRWVVIAVIFGQMLVNFIDRLNLSAAAPQIIKEFHIQPAAMGVLFSAFTGAYALSQIPGGWLADRVGAKKVLAAAVLWWSGFTALTGLAGSYTALALARIGLGVGEGPSFPAALRLVYNWVPRKERGRGTSIVVSGIRIGGAIALPLVVWIISFGGWRAAFFLTALLGLVWLGFWLVLVEDRPHRSRFVSRAELDHIEGDEDPRRSEPAPVPWRRLLRQPNVIWLPAGNLCSTYVDYIFMTWFPIYLVQARHFTLQQMGAFGGMPLLGAVLGMWLGGFLSDLLSARGTDYFAARKTVSVGGLALAAVLLLIAFVVASPVLSVLLASLGLLCNDTALPLFFATAAESQPGAAATMTGFMNMGANIGGFLSPIVIGITVQALHSFTVAMSTGAVAALLGALLWLAIRRPATSVAVLPARELAAGGR